jgi:hypothetical protein
MDWGAAAIIGADRATPFSVPTAEEGAVAVMGLVPSELAITGAESVAKEPGDMIVL